MHRKKVVAGGLDPKRYNTCMMYNELAKTINPRWTLFSTFKIYTE